MVVTGAAMAKDAPSVAIEIETRLSQSIVWAAQRRFFVRHGIEAWRQGIVPSYITNNPALARSYAETVLGYLRDRLSSGVPITAAARFTIVELGAGCGRFAFLFLQAFTELLVLSGLAETPFRYVMTDLAEANIAFWRDHPALAPFIHAEQLDFARFDAAADTGMTLLDSGALLGPGEATGPLVVIANYMFDGLPQDSFTIRGGVLAQSLISLDYDQPMADPDETDFLERMRYGFTERPLDGPPYAEPDFNAVLARYALSSDEGEVLFPCGALRCVERFESMSGGQLLLLTGDRGEMQGVDPIGATSAHFAVHGSISLPVNYHAMAECLRPRGWTVLTTSYATESLCICAFLRGPDPAGFGQTRAAFQTAIETGSPVDFLIVRRGIEPHYASLGLGQLLSFLRLSGWDPKLIADCAPVLWDRIAAAGSAERLELVRVIRRGWTRYYHLGEASDLAFEFGMLLYGAGAYSQALDRFEDSRRLYGDDARTFWNLGLCHAALGCAAEAGRCLAQAFEHSPDFAVPHAILGKPGGSP